MITFYTSVLQLASERLQEYRAGGSGASVCDGAVRGIECTGATSPGKMRHALRGALTLF
ncbi:MAG: hypothetical protein AB7U29_14150 [Desulfobulbus sp.]